MDKRSFFYQGGWFCYKCGDKIRRGLDHQGETPVNPDNATTYDSYTYPKGPYDRSRTSKAELAGQPEYCRKCLTPIRNFLSPSGISLIIGQMKDYIEKKSIPIPSATPDDLRIWADELEEYNLDHEQKFAITAFDEIYRIRMKCEHLENRRDFLETKFQEEF